MVVKLDYQELTTKEDATLVRVFNPIYLHAFDKPTWLSQAVFIPQWGLITGVYTKPMFRRLGYGKAAILYIQTIAYDMGFPYIHADIYDRDVIGFFEKAGFYVSRKTKIAKNRQSSDCWIMRWEI